eukprot:749492_1
MLIFNIIAPCMMAMQLQQQCVATMRPVELFIDCRAINSGFVSESTGISDCKYNWPFVKAMPPGMPRDDNCCKKKAVKRTNSCHQKCLDWKCRHREPFESASALAKHMNAKHDPKGPVPQIIVTGNRGQPLQQQRTPYLHTQNRNQMSSPPCGALQGIHLESNSRNHTEISESPPTPPVNHNSTFFPEDTGYRTIATPSPPYNSGNNLHSDSSRTPVAMPVTATGNYTVFPDMWVCCKFSKCKVRFFDEASWFYHATHNHVVKCSIHGCNAYLPDRLKWEEHINHKHKSAQYICRGCLKTFHNEKSALEHDDFDLKIAQDVTWSFCEVCNVQLSSIPLAEHHEASLCHKAMQNPTGMAETRCEVVKLRGSKHPSSKKQHPTVYSSDSSSQGSTIRVARKPSSMNTMTSRSSSGSPGISKRMKRAKNSEMVQMNGWDNNNRLRSNTSPNSKEGAPKPRSTHDVLPVDVFQRSLSNPAATEYPDNIQNKLAIQPGRAYGSAPPSLRINKNRQSRERTVRCRYCKRVQKWSKMEEHYIVCPSRCPTCCQLVPMSQMDDHLKLWHNQARCTYCGQLMGFSLMNGHLKVQHDQGRCDHCGQCIIWSKRAEHHCGNYHCSPFMRSRGKLVIFYE